MMTCKYGIISDYAGCTYEELLDLRAKVMDDIIAFEEEKTIEDKLGINNRMFNRHDFEDDVLI